MNELTIQGEPTFSLSPRNLAEAMEFAKIIASSDMVPKDYVNKPGNVLVAVQTGAELGLKPMQSLQGISVINGRPSIWGDAMRALIISHPEFEDLHEDKQDTQCTVTLKRRGRTAVVSTFSMEDAKKAGLAGKSGPWQTAPRRMLQMRAFAFAARDLFADALKGIKSTEELRDYPSDERVERDITPATTPAQLQQAPARPELIECTAEKFAENAAAWRDVILSGKKTPAALVAMLSTKTILTEDQKLTIDSWAHENE
ncbi:recombinase RecT [Massilia sp.]|uniref:recombinase RecT n=1 Tax=Massilia sp. TaxID=1882437 RepID=UPI00352F9E22